MMKILLAISVILLVVLLTGCQAHGPKAATPIQAHTTATLTIKWPARGRLIPLAAQSIKVDVTGPYGFTATNTVDRPATGTTSQVDFATLPVGQLTFTATAYPQAGAQGVAQATATEIQTAQADTPVAISLTMASTITRVVVSASVQMVGVGQPLSLTATAKNATAIRCWYPRRIPSPGHRVTTTWPPSTTTV